MQSEIAKVQSRIFREELDNRVSEIKRVLRRDFPRVAQLSQEAMVYAEQLGDFYHYAWALATSAWANANMNKPDDALTLGSEALQLARVHDFLDVEARIVDTLAIVFTSIGVYDEAAALFRHLLDISGRLEDPELVFMAHHDYGIHLMNAGQIEEGVKHLEIALREIPPQISEDPSAAIIYANLCQMFTQIGQPEKGIVYGEKSLRIAQESRDNIGMGRACTSLAIVCIDRHDFPQAELYIHQARAIAATIQYPPLNNHVSFAEAHFCAQTGRLAEAAVHFEEAYRQAIEGQMLQNAIGQLEALKYFYTELGDHERLADVYRRLSEDLPKLQQQSGDIRISVLKMVFAADKAAIKAEMKLSQQKNAMMEHLTQDFRTPLNLIQEASERMRRYGDHLPLEERRAALQGITSQVNAMRLMLDDVIELLQPEPLALEQPANQSAALVEISAAILTELKRYRLDSARIVTHLPLHQPHIIVPVRAFCTSVAHLLSNALKFSKDDVDFSLSVEHGWLEARVSDSGIGIPENEREMVFQPLYRASNHSQPGHGLGLAIVGKQVAAFGGDVCLESAVGSGTTVTVRVQVTDRSP